ncbi:unnamed protein product [Strongylus vulgaris]|uniref:Uncharacterized protein n=1 Tax=Strongylus vulgaris TaxID=40348 RepID=A0A3P7IRM2_STRVU|nr:unnamed protein product [Strongylus vulgaris]
MKFEEWKVVEPIMLNELIEHLQNMREKLLNDAALMPTDSSYSLISLPDDIPPSKPKKTGFRRFSSKARPSNGDLQANQEVMLINESGQQLAALAPSKSASLRQLRQRNPVSKTLGGDSVSLCPISLKKSDNFSFIFSYSS